MPRRLPIARRRPAQRTIASASLGLLLVASACSGADEADTSTGTTAPTTTTGTEAETAARTALFDVLDNPRMVAAAEATWLDDNAVVMGVVHNGEAQAFPIDQMAYHHIANEPYLVTY